MLPDRVSNLGPLTYESGALPIALRGPAIEVCRLTQVYTWTIWIIRYQSLEILYDLIYNLTICIRGGRVVRWSWVDFQYGASYNLDVCRARALCACSRCGWRLFGHLSFPRGRSGGAMVLGKLPVPGRPTIWITVGQGPTALVVGAGGGCLDVFTLIYPFLSSFSLSLGDGPI